MDEKLPLFLAVGTALMALPIVWVGRLYKQPIWKLLIATVLLTLVGTAGTLLMAYIEQGSFGGLSYYGAVFLVPIAFAIVAFLLWMPYAKLLDLCAMGECMMLALMRVNCLISGCCAGRTLWTMKDGTVVRFPNQIAELVISLLLLALLIYWAYRQPQRCGSLYAWYMVLYGSIRFVLNFMREEWELWDPSKRFPMATIWSIIAVAIGVTWLLCRNRRKAKMASAAEDSLPKLSRQRH